MRKKACIVRRGDNWAVKQPLPDGRYHWKTVGPRKRDAEIVRDEINRRVALGTLYPSEPQTFAEFVEGWLERYAPARPPGDARKLPRLSPAPRALRRLAARDDPRRRRRGSCLRGCAAGPARSGADARHAQDDPARRQGARSDGRRGDLPSEATAPGARRDALPRLDAGRRLASETVEPYGNLVRFACLTGLRQGELFALRDRAIDLARGAIVVEAGAREGKLVPTKTAAGRRQVRLSGEALRILREQLLARAPNELGLVFPTPNGSRLAQGQLHGAGLPASCPAGATSNRSAFTISATPTPR